MRGIRYSDGGERGGDQVASCQAPHPPVVGPEDLSLLAVILK